MNTSSGSLNCKICGGDQEIPVYIVNDEVKKAHLGLMVCPCTGTSRLEEGERLVGREEYNRLKLEWAKPATPKDQSFQAAA